MSNHIIDVTEETFDAIVLKSEKPVLVDFWAPWCAPCKMIAPLLEALALKRDDIIIAKVDIDDNREIPAQYSVRGIPTLMIFDKGHLKATKVGALTSSHLELFLAQNI
jgi:thioredoxin 1